MCFLWCECLICNSVNLFIIAFRVYRLTSRSRSQTSSNSCWKENMSKYVRMQWQCSNHYKPTATCLNKCASVPGKRCVPADGYWKRSLAHWCDHGGYPCSYWTREDFLQTRGARPQRWDAKEIHSGENLTSFTTNHGVCFQDSWLHISLTAFARFRYWRTITNSGPRLHMSMFTLCVEKVKPAQNISECPLHSAKGLHHFHVAIPTTTVARNVMIGRLSLKFISQNCD